ncbi:MAG: hypothetical protein J7L73_01625 [Anaerolineales bacterium]|nr:hypothetical protein [Anaerolineales bacterium]HEY62688.1 hypothetical protein [Anaerolineae bacterium]
MNTLRKIAKRKPKLINVFLWFLAIILTIAMFTYQDKTGPTYPLTGDIQTSLGEVHFKFLRSETIGNSLKIMFLNPVPDGVTGFVQYRRYKSNDEWQTMPMNPVSFEVSHHGKTEKIAGFGAELPSLNERAGKYEYYVYLQVNDDEPLSITGDKPIYARYKGAVPTLIITIHVLIIFLSMMFALRTVFEAMIDGNFKWMIWATLISFLFGAFLFGPWVQWYAFGVWWSGIPFGYDWTDNKVLLELVFWIYAAYANRGNRRDAKSVYFAGIATLLVYFIPHSLFGSEYDYRTGIGRGTTG